MDREELQASEPEILFSNDKQVIYARLKEIKNAMYDYGQATTDAMKLFADDKSGYARKAGYAADNKDPSMTASASTS